MIPATTWRILYQDTESSGCFKSFKGIPFASFKIFSSLEEISYEPDTYYQLRSKIFKTVDSFVIMTRKTLETWFPELRLNRKQGEEEELYLVFFQSTVSSNHIVDGPQLNLIRKAICERGCSNTIRATPPSCRRLLRPTLAYSGSQFSIVPII